MLADINRFIELHQHLNRQAKTVGYDKMVSKFGKLILKPQSISRIDGDVSEANGIKIARAYFADNKENIIYDVYEESAKNPQHYSSMIKVYDLLNMKSFICEYSDGNCKTNGFRPQNITQDDQKKIKAWTL